MNNLEIKKIRKELRLTQESLAEKLKVSKSLVQKWESGERIPDDYIISELRKIYKIAQKQIQQNILNEDQQNYLTGRDKKIAEYREEIESIKEEITFWEQKKIENPEKENVYESYITDYEKQIKLIIEMTNIALKAQKDEIDNK